MDRLEGLESETADLTPVQGGNGAKITEVTTSAQPSVPNWTRSSRAYFQRKQRWLTKKQTTADAISGATGLHLHVGGDSESHLDSRISSECCQNSPMVVRKWS